MEVLLLNTQKKRARGRGSERERTAQKKGGMGEEEKENRDHQWLEQNGGREGKEGEERPALKSIGRPGQHASRGRTRTEAFRTLAWPTHQSRNADRMSSAQAGTRVKRTWGGERKKTRNKRDTLRLSKTRTARFKSCHTPHQCRKGGTATKGHCSKLPSASSARTRSPTLPNWTTLVRQASTREKTKHTTQEGEREK